MAMLVSRSTADLFVSAAGANSVMRFDRQTGQSLGNFVQPGSGGLGDPQGIAFGPDGNLYVASNGSNNILRYDGQTGDFIDVFITPGMGWPAEINFRNGSFYVSDFTGNRVAQYDLNGNFISNFAVGIQGADGQSWDANGDLYVSSWADNTIKKFDGSTGASLGNFVGIGGGGLSGPLDNLFLPNGELLVSSFASLSIKRYDASGNYIDDPITGLTGGPQGLQIGPDGNLYAGDFGRGLINKYDIDSFAFLGTFASTGGTSTTNNFVFRPDPVPEPGSIPLVAMLTVFSVAFCRGRFTKKY